MSQPAKTESGWFSRLFGGGGTAGADSLIREESQSSSSSSGSNSNSPFSGSGIQKKVDHAKNLMKNFSSPNNGTPRNITVKTLKTLGSPVSIIQKTPIDKRKRQHLENGTPTGPVEDIFSQRSTKRFCGTANLSLVEEPIRITVPERLDITWAGDRLTDASPASSVRSLRSRLSGQASTASSGLSSKTRAILQQLERVHTPARESRRLPIVRGPTTFSERWTTASAPLAASIPTGAPPLRKIRVGPTGPTRLQMLSNHMGFPAKKTYLKDLHRPTMKERDEAAKAREEGNQNGGNGTDLNGSRLHPIFEIPNARASPKKTTPEAERRHKVSVLKGTDGISRNVFNTRDLEDDEDRNPLPVPKAVSMPMSTVPQKGFLGDLSFTFELPKDRFGTCNGAKSSVNTSFEQQDSSDNDESDTTESTSGKVSSVSGVSTSSSPIPDEPKQKAPEEKKVPEVVITGPKEDAKPSWDCTECFVKNTGDKDNCACCSHPKGAPAVAAAKKDPKPFQPMFGGNPFAAGPTSTTSTEKWSCSGCFVENTGDKCVCCETPRGGGGSTAAPAQKQLVSNLSSFTSTKPVSFGFGAGPAATTAPATSSTFTAEAPKEIPAPAASKPIFGTGVSSTTSDKPAETASTPKITFGMTASSSSPNLFGSATQNGAATTSKITFGAPPVAPAPAPAAAPANEESWDCGACFLKSTGDKCVVCATPRASSTAVVAAKKELVSNLSNFAPAAPVKFGFGVSSTTPAPPTSSAAPATATKTPTFGMTPSSSSPSLFDTSKKENGAPTATAASAATATAPTSIFGNSTTTSLFGNTPAPSTTTTEAPKLTFGAGTEAPKPLFGSSPLFGSKPADKPLFGSTEARKPPFEDYGVPLPLFGASASTSTPPKPLFGSTEAPKPLFGNLQSAEAPKLTFGAPTAPAGSGEASKITFGAPAASSEAPKPLFGSTPAPGSLFGQSAAAPSPFALGFGATPAPTVPAFGSKTSAPAFGSTSDQPSAKKPMFGGFNNAAPASSGFGGSSSNLFGQSNPSAPAPSSGFNFGAPSAAPAFGAPAPSLTASASAGSLFAPTGGAPSGFNFGAAAPQQGNQPFVFGQQTTSPFGSAPAPGGGAFAYNATTSTSAGASHSGAARKIAQARRRMPGRR